MNGDIPSKYSPLSTEREIRQFWDEKKAYERSKEKRSKGKDLYFLDSPHQHGDMGDASFIYSMIVKDSLLRHFRMRGWNVKDTAGIWGYDPKAEMDARERMGLSPDEEPKNSEEYIRQCRKEAKNIGEDMADFFKKMAVWLDWKRHYTFLDNKYAEAVWYTFKELNSRGLLGRFRGISHWCPQCRTFLSKSEIKTEMDWKRGIYVKFPLKKREKSYLVSWFSEPWRITATLALEVIPSKKYSVIEIKNSKEKIIIGSEERKEVLKNSGIMDYRVTGEITGDKLVGMRYSHPLFGSLEEEGVIDISEMESEDLRIDRIIAGRSGGSTGIKPIVPAHSAHDLALAEKNDIPILTPVGEDGSLGDETGKYSGFLIFDSESIIIRDLVNTGMALSPYDVRESVRYCERCGSRTIPRISEEWAFKPANIGEKTEEISSEVDWRPAWMMGGDYDWMHSTPPIPISKKGLWGVPMPVWVCSCGNTEIIGSARELEDKSPEFKVGMGLQRPWADRYTVPCSKCGKPMKRVEDVLSSDFAAMCASWGQLHYPAMESDFKRWWPADLVVEPLKKSRGWIYSQLSASAAIFEKAPFEKVLGTGNIDTGKKEKSISRLLDIHGADIVRYALLKYKKPWESRGMGKDALEEAKKVFNTLWNLHRFVATYFTISDFKPEEVSLETVHEYGLPQDRWILSVIEGKKDEYIRAMDGLSPDDAVEALESLIRTVSRWYLRSVRSRIKSADLDRKEVLAGYRALYEAILICTKFMAPFAPHIAEEIYLNLGGKETSVHSDSIDVPNKLLMDRNLEIRMEIAMDIIRSGRTARRKAGIAVRWPMERMVVKAASREVVEAVELFGDFIREELNIRSIEVVPPAQEWEEMMLEVEPNPDAIGLVYRQWSSRIAVMLKNRPAKKIREGIKKGEYYLGIEGQLIKILPNMVRFISSLPDYVVDQNFLDGSVYLDVRREESLFVEGRMKQIVRMVQDMRKDLNLRFLDYIDLYISGDEKIEEAVERWGEEIADITRSREVILTNEEGIEGEYIVEWAIEGERVIIGIVPLYWEEMISVMSKIPGVSRQRAEAIFDAGYTNLASLLSASPEDLSQIPGVNSGMAKKISTYMEKNFSGGAVLEEFGEGKYRCSACGAVLDEPADVCPKCGLPLRLKEKEEKEEKPEEERPTEAEEDFIKMLSDIKGIGPSLARALFKAGYHDQESLKKASVEDLLKIPRMSRALAEILLEGAGARPKKPEEEKIEEMSEDEFVSLITKIKGIGPSKARKIYDAGYHSIDSLKKADVADIAKIPRMSRALAELVKEFIGESSEEKKNITEGLRLYRDMDAAYRDMKEISGSLDSILCLTRESSKKIKSTYGLKNAEIHMVSGSAKKALRPNELDKIALTVDKFVSSEGKKAIIIDAVDSMISENSFDSVMRFLDYLKEESESKNFFIFIVLNTEILKEGEKKIIMEKTVSG